MYQWQDEQWVLIGYHSKRLPDAVSNYGVCELELTGLVCNIHGFEHLVKDNYFEVIIDLKAIEYLKRAKYQLTTRCLGSLLLKLQDYAFDIKYLEGAKLKVSDALSRLYIDEEHKITDIISLNFLLDTAKPFIHLEYLDSTNELYTHKAATIQTKTSERATVVGETNHGRSKTNNPKSKTNSQHQLVLCLHGDPRCSNHVIG